MLLTLVAGRGSMMRRDSSEVDTGAWTIDFLYSSAYSVGSRKAGGVKAMVSTSSLDYDIPSIPPSDCFVWLSISLPSAPISARASASPLQTHAAQSSRPLADATPSSAVQPQTRDCSQPPPESTHPRHLTYGPHGKKVKGGGCCALRIASFEIRRPVWACLRNLHFGIPPPIATYAEESIRSHSNLTLYIAYTDVQHPA